MKQHRAAASASEPNVEICKDRQRVAPHAALVEDRCRLAAGRTAPEDANMEVAESTAGQPTSSVIRTWEAEDDTSAKRQRLMAGMLTWTSTWTRTSWLLWRRCPTTKESGFIGSLTGTRNTSEPRVETCLIHRCCMKVD